MAVAYDNSTTAQTASAASLTFAHTTTGADLGLLLAVASYPGGVAISATYNGVCMKPVVHSSWFVDADPNHLWVFRLEGPALGANNVVVTAESVCEIVAIALSITGAEQSNLTSASVIEAESTSPYVHSVPSNVGELVVDFISYYNTTVTVDAAQTQRINQNNGASLNSLACSTKAGATSVSMQWTGADSFNCHAVIAVQAVLPAPQAVTMVGYIPDPNRANRLS